MSSEPPPTFNKAKHIKYWLRCLKTHLPTQYTSNDSQRTTLAFFILSALDLLGALHEHTTLADRTAYINWIYKCQHPQGGFRGFTGTNFGEGKRDEWNGGWDPANVAATYFSLAALTVLGDGLERVKRKECWEWLKGLQLTDGSFGEARGEGLCLEGERDVRFCYCAAAVRWILRRVRGIGENEEREEEEGDIDVEGLVRFITSSQSYEGGIGREPFHEAHAGCTYCGIATLSLLGRLPLQAATEATAAQRSQQSSSPHHPAGSSTIASAENPTEEELNPEFLDALTRWLVYRQTKTTPEEDFEVHEDDFPSPVVVAKPAGVSHDWESGGGGGGADGGASRGGAAPPLFYVQGASTEPGVVTDSVLPPIGSQPLVAPPSLDPALHELNCAGFNGRCNKASDTCYGFWVGGALAIMHKVHLLDFTASRNYLLSKAQHVVGGFGKYPGDPPDILHSYLGLAALAAMRESELRTIDPMLCISVSARDGLLNREHAGVA